MLSPDHVIYALNTTLSITAKNSLKEAYFSGYNISSLDVRISFSDNHIETLILSENEMANIGMDIFKDLKSSETSAWRTIICQ